MRRRLGMACQVPGSMKLNSSDVSAINSATPLRPLSGEPDRITEAAWDAYYHFRKSPLTHKAAPGYADPDYDPADDWIAAHEAITAAQSAHEDRNGASCILLINGSPRSEHTCANVMPVSGFNLAVLFQRASAVGGR